ncbi:MAG TPA: hypothetical protein VFQ61_11680 [Polyangiaceae bacterium]|nr:hypothetical protein [Polyangiaceae bacterium]
MMELDSDARRLLELAREARTPTLADKIRIESALSQALQAAAAGGATGSVATGGGAAASTTKSTVGLATAKWLAALSVPALVVGALQLRNPETGEPSGIGAASVVATRRVASNQVVVTPSAAHSTPQTDPGFEPAVASHGDFVSRNAGSRARSASKPSAPDSLNQELDLLHAAQKAWRSGQAKQALVLIERHQREYPRSVLGLERDALRILSLCAAGREGEAKALARRFNGRRSPLGAAVEQSCAAD